MVDLYLLNKIYLFYNIFNREIKDNKMGQLLDKEEELDEHYCTVQIKEFFKSRQGCRRTNQHLAEFVEMCTQHISSMKKLIKQHN